MTELLLTTAFLAGLLGSVHCVGMCGGIAAALGGTREPGPTRRGALLLYNAGRIASYTIAGALAGAAGSVTAAALAGRHATEWLRLATAMVVVLIGLNLTLGRARRPAWVGAPERWGAALWRRVGPALQRHVPNGPLLRPLGMGILWGWLPCGLVYSALLAAAASGGPALGAATLFAFGLGTVPAMAGIGYSSGRLWRSARSPRLLGATLTACGLWTGALPFASLVGLSDHAHHDSASTAATYVAHHEHARGR